MEIPPIIGICGDMGAGKDTLAAEIVRRMPEYHIRKFATMLREAQTFITGIPARNTLTDADKATYIGIRWTSLMDVMSKINAMVMFVTGNPSTTDTTMKIIDLLIVTDDVIVTDDGCSIFRMKNDMTIGRLLQILGTDVFRELAGPDVWVNHFIKQWREDGRPAIIAADVRFPNEFKAVVDNGGIVIRVVRDNAARADGRDVGHASERALDATEPDFILQNNGTVEELGDAFMAALHAGRCQK